MSCYHRAIKLTKNICQSTLLKREVIIPRYYSNIERVDSSTSPTDLSLINSTPAIQRVDHELDSFIKENMKIPKALDECQEDLSFIAPYVKPTFNFASVANESKTVQELVKLGVELYKIEARRGGLELILKLKFDEDIKPYIQFITDCGVPANRLSRFITRNPYIFTEDMDDLKTRIRYLRAHNFSTDDIAAIVDKNPDWLSYKTTSIDERLGYLQNDFRLSGVELRNLIVKNPRIATLKKSRLIESTFSVREEMGFDPHQVKQILLNNPFIWLLSRDKVLATFNYVHNTMGICHEAIANQPAIIGKKVERIQQRHMYLKTLKRNQYDPLKPLYISLDSIALGTDLEFCTNVAKTSIYLYDLFLKTL